MKQLKPPSWMEWILFFLLPARDRETVPGDLCEEFAERKQHLPNSTRPDLWYLRQVLSFAPRRIVAAFVQVPALVLLCAFTAMSGAWLGAMELRFKHSGYAGREVIAATIVGEALLTLIALRFRHPALRMVAMAGTVGIVWLAGTALVATVRGAHPEGYVLLIALALLLQALFTLFTLPSASHPQRRRA